MYLLTRVSLPRTLGFRSIVLSPHCEGIDRVPEELIPKNPLEKYYPESKQPEFGRIYDKRPFRMELEAGKKYAWCCCGRSASQPLCDNTHKIQQLKIKLRPVFFTVEKSGTYWLCNCKQTLHRPFCDGTHRREDVQEAHKF